MYSAKKLMASLKYGFKKALEIFIGKWKVSRELGETIIQVTLIFVFGSIAFVRLANTEQKSLKAYTSYIKKVAGNFTGTLIKTAKNQLIKRLGRTAALKIIVGVAGVGLSEGVVFTYNLSYYAIKYYRN